MNIDQMIERLQEIKAKHGNLEVVGGFMTDDSRPQSIIVINSDGSEYTGGEEETVEGIFIE